MALVRSTSSHEEMLDRGVAIQPSQIINIDAALPIAVRLLARGTLQMIDDSVDSEDLEPFLNIGRRLFVGSTQPTGLRPSDLWIDTTERKLKEGV